MKVLTNRLFLVTLLVSTVVASLGLREPAHAWQAAPNLLKNPGFEEGFFAWGGINEVQVAHGWTPWWRVRTDADPEGYYHRPEYKHANGYIFPSRVHGGASAQQWFTFYSTHEAGMYQQVFNVTSGTRYRFTIWAQVWSSTDDNPDVSVNPAHPRLQIGIHPAGSWDPWSSEIVWSDTFVFYDSWGQLSVETVARGDIITVFMRSHPDFPVKHNDTYWDDAVLVAVDGSGAPPPPTNTSGAPPPPTATCAPPPAGWVTYTVQRGNTLFSLAKLHGTTVDAIVAANCLRKTDIYVGQQLLLPPLPPTATPSGETPTATFTPVPATPSATASATAKPTSTPTTIPTATPVPDTATPSLAPSATSAPTAATAPVAAITGTPTAPRATIPPPFTPTTGPLVPPSTSTPSGSSTRPCGTMALSVGIVALAGVLRFRQGGKSVKK